MTDEERETLHNAIADYLSAELKKRIKLELKRLEQPDGYFNASMVIRDVKQDVISRMMERENKRRMNLD